MFPHKYSFSDFRNRPGLGYHLTIIYAQLYTQSFLKSVLHIDSSIWRDDGASPMGPASST